MKDHRQAPGQCLNHHPAGRGDKRGACQRTDGTDKTDRTDGTDGNGGRMHNERASSARDDSRWA